MTQAQKIYKCCNCGKRRSRFAPLGLCRKCSLAATQKHFDAVGQIVAIGNCPDCGRPLRRNMALAGWWQCSQFGAECFRAEPQAPACNWQGFTE